MTAQVIPETTAAFFERIGGVYDGPDLLSWGLSPGSYNLESLLVEVCPGGPQGGAACALPL